MNVIWFTVNSPLYEPLTPHAVLLCENMIYMYLLFERFLLCHNIVAKVKLFINSKKKKFQCLYYYNNNKGVQGVNI